VTAVTHRAPCSIAIAQGVSGGRGEARGIIEAVADAHPELELVAHEQDSDALAALVWIGEPDDVEALQKGFRALRGPGGEWKLMTEHGAAFVSLVGLGLGGREAARAEAALERAGVSLVALRVTPTALVFRLPGERAEAAARALHAAFLEPGPASVAPGAALTHKPAPG
jgi:aspartokinase